MATEVPILSMAAIGTGESAVGLSSEKLDFHPLAANEVGNVWMSGSLFMNGRDVSNVGNFYGSGSSDVVQLHMPPTHPGNLYINWHTGESLIFGGGKKSPHYPPPTQS